MHNPLAPIKGGIRWILLIMCGLILISLIGYPSVVHCEGSDELPFIQEFSNLNITANLKSAKDSLFNQSGIYCIKCLETGTIYIGSSGNLGNRLVAHIFNYSSNIHLQNAITMYGLSCFVFYVWSFVNLINCYPVALPAKQEQHYLDWLFSLLPSLRFF